MELTVDTIAALAGGRVEGDGSALVSTFAKIEEAGPGSLTFIANPKYAHCIHTTRATAVLVGEDFEAEGEIGPTLIRVADPYTTLALLLSHFQPRPHTPSGAEQPCFVAEGVEVPEDCYIGAFSYISPEVKIGRGVRIYPGCYVGKGVSLGEDTVLRSGVRIYEGCSVGARCILHSGVVVGADGFGFAPGEQGYDKIPQIGNVVIEDDVEVGANTTIDRATFGSTRIGKGTKLDNLLMVAHNVEIGSHNVFAAQTGIAGSTKIGDWNRVGGQVGFAGHIHIGSFNEIGAQTGIPRNVGDHRRLIGYPAVEASVFARNTVYINKLQSLYSEVARLSREIEKMAQEGE